MIPCSAGATLLLLLGAGAVMAASGGESIASGSYAGLDRLLERLGGTPAPPSPPPLPSTPGPRPRLRHHHHHRHQDLLDTEEEEEESPEVNSNEAQSDSNRRFFFPNNNKGNDNRFDWKKAASRKTVDKLWNEYRSGYKNTGVSSVSGPSLVTPVVGEDQEQAHNEVFRHNVKMARETVCRVPQLKVIRAADHYPSSAKVYMPACTRLHQCAQDTGCCPPTQKCGPKTTHRVELYFYVLQTTGTVGGGKRPPAALGIEKLPFYNHTECECQDRSDEMPRDTNPIDNSVGGHQTPSQPQNKQGCECPSEYTVRYLSNGSCSCDCFDKQRDCTKYKRGKEYFNHQDRLCIATGSCTLPACDFGVYMKRLGRCPRKHEKYRSWPRYT